MKNFFLALLITILFSCSKDDSDNSVLDKSNETRSLSNSEVEEGIVIANSKIIQGDFPSMEGEAYAELSKNEYEAFQRVGFEMRLEAFTISEFEGFYFQVLEEDGTPSDKYFDVKFNKTPDFSALALRPYKRFDFFDDSNKDFVREERAVRSDQIKNFEDSFIEVKFKELIKAGEFCFRVAVYDKDNNVSEPIKRCVKVKEWGGDKSLIGSWSFIKKEEFRDGELEDLVEKGGKDCGDIIPGFDCNERRELCDRIDEFKISLNSDGTFNYQLLGAIENIVKNELDECNPTIKQWDYNINGEGFWNEDLGEMKGFLIDFDELLFGDSRMLSLDKGVIGIGGNMFGINQGILKVTQNRDFVFSEIINGRSSPRTIKFTTDFYFQKK